MKNLIFCLVLMCGAVAHADVNIMTVTDEDRHTKKEDFYHTFEYHISPLGRGGSGSKCQATRIGRRWFATAAHCVETCVAGGCRIQMDLLDEPFSVLAQVDSTPKRPAVFVHPKYNKKVFPQNDFTLIRLDLNKAPLVYYKRVNRTELVGIFLQQFQAYLRTHRAAAAKFRRVMRGDLPPIVAFDDDTYLIDRKLSVISIFDGVRDVKQNPYKAYYVKDLGFAYTQNFGIRKGMSGSGVMTNTGELIGVVSGTLNWQRYSSAQGKTEEKDFFLFLAFNKSVRAFMESVMGSDYYKLDFKDAYPQFIKHGVRGNHSLIRQGVRDVRNKNKKK